MMNSSAHGLWRLPGRIAAGFMRVGLFLLLLDFILFALFDLLPDAAIQRLGVMAIGEELLNATRERLGVSGPWYERFLQFWWHLLQGDLGHSLQRRFSCFIGRQELICASVGKMWCSGVFTICLCWRCVTG